MKLPIYTRSFRFWSWLVGAASIAPVAFYAYQEWQFSRWAKQQAADSAFVCGTGIVALFMLCVLVAAVLSVSAMLLSLVGYLKLHRPRPKTRMLEIALLGAGFIFAGAVVVGISLL